MVAEAAGDPERALRALERAQDRQPEEWTLYLLEARVLAGTDPSRAAAAVARARELNPRGSEIDQLELELQKNQVASREPDADN